MQDYNQGSTNQNWSFTFSGLSQVDGLSSGPLIADEGYYVATIEKNYVRSERPNAIEFECTISEGKFKGAKISKGITLPSHANNMFIWKSLFESIGYSKEQIEAPQFQPNPQDWNGRQVHVYWRPGNKDLQVYRELLFMSKSTWDSRKQSFERKQAAEASAAPAGSAASGVTAGLGVPQAPQAPQAPSNPAPQIASQSAPAQSGFMAPSNPAPQSGNVNTNALLNQLRG